MLTSEELKQEGRKLLYGVFVGSLGMMAAAKYKEDIYRAIDCIIEAAVMEARTQIANSLEKGLV